MSRATWASAPAFTTALRRSVSWPSARRRVGPVDEVGDDPAEHRVAEELQPLVGGVARELRAPRAVRQGLAEQGRVLEPVAEALGERLQIRPGGQGLLHPLVDVVDGVADRLQVLQVLVLDAEADGALGQLLLEGLDQLDEGERVGLQVVGERLAFVMAAGSISRMSASRSRTSSKTSWRSIGPVLHVGLGGQRLSLLDVRVRSRFDGSDDDGSYADRSRRLAGSWSPLPPRRAGRRPRRRPPAPGPAAWRWPPPGPATSRGR